MVEGCVGQTPCGIPKCGSRRQECRSRLKLAASMGLGENGKIALAHISHDTVTYGFESEDKGPLLEVNTPLAA